VKNLPLQLGAALYAIGVIAVQSHLSRYGAADAGLLEIHYFAVGAWILLSAAPAIVAIGAAELYLLRTPKLVLALAAAFVTVLLIAVANYQMSYDLVGSVFDFNAYPYPPWFIPWNLSIWNVVLVLIWIVLLMFRKLDASAQLVRRVGVGAVAVLTAMYSVFFGRVVYPALSAAAGGGAPHFSTITLAGAPQPALIVYMTSDLVYYLPIRELPVGMDTRSPRDRYLAGAEGPVWDAVARNLVVVRARQDISEIVLIGFSQEALLRRHHR
jgi:hypothetical protein